MIPGGAGPNLDELRNANAKERMRFVLNLSLSAGIGGFLFGYDTGVISGALLYIKDDFSSVNSSTFLQEVIVSIALLGAAVGASYGGRLNDKYGRKTSILASDVVFILGAISMAAAPDPYVIIFGRLLVGLGIGAASMTVPLYISEVSPPSMRGALVSTNVLMITMGQFIAYCVNLAFTGVHGTWRWMLGVSALPALLQIFLMLPLPESPRWLANQGRHEEVLFIMRKIQSKEEMVQDEEEKEDDLNFLPDGRNKDEKVVEKESLRDLLSKRENRSALIVGMGLQIFQQLVGINTVMYYGPTIVEYAGYASHQTALFISMIIAAVNSIGTVLGIFVIDRFGRRQLILSSLVGVFFSLLLLTVSFHLASQGTPMVKSSSEFVGDSSLLCPQASSSLFGSFSCDDCLNSGCGFCADEDNEMFPGFCLVYNTTASNYCWNSGSSWFSEGCPSNYGWMAMVGLGLYMITFSPGMGPVPWAVNSEIYPHKLRSLGNGFSATANWISNLFVAQTFLSLVDWLGISSTFFIFAIVSVFAFVFIFFCLPETKGMSFLQVESMWAEKRSLWENWKWFSTVDTLHKYDTIGASNEDEILPEGLYTDNNLAYQAYGSMIHPRKTS